MWLTLTPAVPRLLNELTKSQHVCIQHAAASLLLMEPVVITTVGSFENMVHLVIKDLKGGRPRHNEVFGVNLHYLAKHEGTDSHWGFHEHLVRIPSILHDLMTAIHLKGSPTRAHRLGADRALQIPRRRASCARLAM